MNTRKYFKLASAIGLLAIMFSTPVSAIDVVKADNVINLNVGGAWVGGNPPSPTDVAVWDSTVSVNGASLLGADLTWLGIRVSNPALDISVGAGNALTLGASGIDLSAATVNLSLGNGVTLGASQAWSVGASRVLTVSSPLAGAAGLVLTKEGPGTLVLSSIVNGTFAGNTVINGGVLQLNSANANNNSALGTGIITNNGATLQLGGSRIIGNAIHFIGNCVVDCNNFASPLDGAWSGDSSAVVLINNLTTGTFTIGGNGNGGGNMGSFVGTIRLADNTAGTVRFNNGGGNNAVGNVNAVFDLGNSTATLVSRNNTTINLGELRGGEGTKLSGQSNGGGTTVWSIGGKGTSTTFAGSITDATTARTNAIAKVGAGTLILTGTNNSYSATTTVSGGTLQVGNGGTSGTLGTGPIVNNAALVYSRSDAVVVSNAISGSGSLTLQGGVVTFEGTNTSSGTLVVNAGAAEVGASGSIQSPVSLATGTYLIVTNNPLFTLNQILSGSGTVDGLLTAVGGTIRPGGSGAGGTLSFNAGLVETGNVTHQFELATSGSTDLISITGNLTVSGTNSMVVSKLGGGPLALGTYPLISYTGSFNGGLTNFSVSVAGVTGTLTNPPNQIALIVTPAARGATNLTWAGGGANNWDDDISTNWVNGAAQFTFKSGDSVRFDATGAANPTVNLASAILLPTAVVVAAPNDYTFTGLGSINGGTGLIKSNTGTLFIQTTNGYTGPTLVTGGVLDINNLANGNSPSAIGAAISDPTNLVLNGGSLRYSGADASTDRGATLSGASVILDVTAANLNFNGSPITGPGTLAKAGAGTLTLSVPNSYSGGTVLSNGVLALGSNAANNNGTGGSGLGATNNPVTFRGGTLQLFGYNGGTGNNFNTVYNPLIVPVGEIGTLQMFPRGPVNSGGNAGLQSRLTGGGTLNLVVNYVRDDLSGDWSAFTGVINVTAKNAADEMRVNNNFGYANATINLNDGVTLCRSFTANTVNDIGALTGTALATVGPGNSSGANTTWRIGWLNTSDTFAGTIADAAGTTIVKVGAGTWTLSGVNTANSTIVSNGVLAVTGSLIGANIRVASGAFLDVSTPGSLSLVTGQTLGGNGVVWGSVDTTGGGTIAPGFSIGTLNVTNNVTLGGEVMMEVNRNGGSPVADKLVTPVVTLGGKLRVVNTGAPLQIGDTFDLFDGAISGSFTTLILGYNTWNTSQLAVNGTITVTGVLPPPSLSFTYDGANLTLNASGIPDGIVAIVTSTNAAAPLDSWTVVQGGFFDLSGNYTASVPVDPATPQRFYTIRAQ